MVRRGALLLLVALLASSMSADELSVDRTTLTLDDTLTITVSLGGSFTSLDSVEIPVQNLKIVGSPSVSSEVTWINGTLTQRKVLQYQARPLAVGPAVAGPLTIATRGGERETLPAVTVQVMPDVLSQTNEPEQLLRELISTNRDPFFVVVEADRTSAFVGEEIVVTWTLYNAATVEQWQIADVPKLEDFWSEEIGVSNEQAQTIRLGPYAVQRLVVRRVALFPLHAGRLQVAPLEVRAAIMRRNGDFGPAPLGIFEGSVVEVARHCVPLTIDVQPLPAGPPIDIIGDVALTCGKAVQANGGPVALEVGLSGRANLRNASPPHWTAAVDGSTQIGEGKVTVTRSADGAVMNRRWKLLVFPSHAGRFVLPPLVTRAFSPAGGRQELRCDAQTLNVVPAAMPGEVGTSRPHRADETSALLYAAIGAAVLIPLLLLFPRMRRAMSIRRAARSFARPRDRVRERLVAAYKLDETALMREASDRGDAWRALVSLLDALERERVDIADADNEVELRVRDFLQSAP